MQQMDVWRMEQFSKGFDRNFHAYQNKRIAVYGIGKNAERVLSYTVGFDFSAVVAKDHFGKLFCGKKIVPLNEALKESDLMVIAATPQATKEVFARIRSHIPEGYHVMDPRIPLKFYPTPKSSANPLK